MFGKYLVILNKREIFFSRNFIIKKFIIINNKYVAELIWLQKKNETKKRFSKKIVEFLPR